MEGTNELVQKLFVFKKSYGKEVLRKILYKCCNEDFIGLGCDEFIMNMVI